MLWGLPVATGSTAHSVALPTVWGPAEAQGQRGRAGTLGSHNESNPVAARRARWGSLERRARGGGGGGGSGGTWPRPRPCRSETECQCRPACAGPTCAHTQRSLASTHQVGRRCMPPHHSAPAIGAEAVPAAGQPLLVSDSIAASAR